MVALKMIKDHPFLGIGMGTFMSNFAKYRYDLQVSYAHNCYLQIWAETGPFSLLSFLAFVFSVIYLGTKRFLSGNSYLLLGLLAGVLGFLVHSFFEVNLYSFRLAIMFWAWMGLTIAMIQHRSFN
jgi:O-antigen ligase